MFANLINRMVWARVEEAIPRILEEKLPAAIERAMARLLADNPDAPLTRVGFRWAFYIGLRKHWPDVTREEAEDWVDEYVGVPHGTKGYVWTARAADDLARQYALEFGEAA